MRHAGSEHTPRPSGYDAELQRHNELLRRACGVQVRDHILDIGPDVAAALGWVRGFTSTSEVLTRLEPAAAARAVGRLREMLSAHLSDDGVWFYSRAWIITARRH